MLGVREGVRGKMKESQCIDIYKPVCVCVCVFALIGGRFIWRPVTSPPLCVMNPTCNINLPCFRRVTRRRQECDDAQAMWSKHRDAVIIFSINNSRSAAWIQHGCSNSGSNTAYTEKRLVTISQSFKLGIRSVF